MPESQKSNENEQEDDHQIESEPKSQRQEFLHLDEEVDQDVLENKYPSQANSKNNEFKRK